MTTPAPAGFNADMMMNYLTMSMFNNLSLTKLNWATIAKLLLVICLAEIKSELISGVKSAKTKLITWLKLWWTYLSKAGRIIRFTPVVPMVKQPCPTTKYKLTITNEIKDQLLSYLARPANQDHCYYYAEPEVAVDCRYKETVFDQCYQDISLQLNDCRFVLLNKLSKSQNYLTNKKILITQALWSSEALADHKKSLLTFYQYFSQLLKEPTANYELNCQVYQGLQSLSSENCLIQTYQIHCCCNSTGPNQYCPYHYLIKTYDQLGLPDNYKFLLANYLNGLLTLSAFDWQKELKRLMDKCLQTKILETPFFEIEITPLFCVTINYDKKDTTQYRQDDSSLAQLITQHYQTYQANRPVNDKLELTFHLYNQHASLTDQEQINWLLNRLKQDNQRINRVKTYALKVVTTEQIEELDNPEYQTYLENKELIGQMIEKSGRMDQLINLPAKKLRQVKSIKEVKETLITEREKSFDTLYLKEKDEQKLRQLLEQYNANTVFTTLELPKKLGLILHGPPGVGKSTTIQVIGSYLGKNIYYVNLSGLTKCSELKLIFDHVINHCSGIIVFEDIDCQTEIVLKRQEQSALRVAEMSDDNEDRLNLAYFLNLLDGSLCAEETIFIFTTNHLERLDPALYRKGRVDISLELTACDHYQIAKIYQKIIGQPLEPEILQIMPSLTHTPADLIFHLVQFIYDKQDSTSMLSKFLTI